MNKYQCPQCGAASSMKTGPTTYHCIYCNSSFDVPADKKDMLNSMLGQNAANRQEMLAKIEELKAKRNSPEYRRQSRMALVIVLSILLFVGGMVGFIVHKASNAMSSGMTGMLGGSNWSTVTISEYNVFSGSKGTVTWQLYEQSGYSLDSERYIMRIVDPQKNSVIKEFAFVPTVTWDEGFNSSEFIGQFYAFGDTCWIMNEKDGLIARNANTGDVIIDKTRLGKMFPKLASGITKASYYEGQGYFDVTTNDGFEYAYCPWYNKLYTKDEWEALDDQKNRNVTRNFFTLSDDDKRPQLYVSNETVSAFDIRSNVFSSELDEYSSNGIPSYYSKTIHTVKKVSPDKVYFNGIVEYADDKKAIIAYQESNNKKAKFHVCAVDATGKELWNVSGTDLQVFQETFASSNHSLEKFVTGNKIILFLSYDNNQTIQLDMTSGKTDWTYNSKSTQL